MYPEFTIDGVPFTAQRNYTHVQGFPVASILCTAVDMDALLPPASPLKRLGQRVFSLCLPVVLSLILAVYIWSASDAASRQEPGFWVIEISLLVLGAVISVRNYYLAFNENGKRGQDPKS